MRLQEDLDIANGFEPIVPENLSSYLAFPMHQGTFLGHYSGTISQIGFTKKGKAWHYMFHLINGFGVDGTAGENWSSAWCLVFGAWN